MLKQKQKRWVLKPFILAYGGEADHPSPRNPAKSKSSQDRLNSTREIIYRVVERIKRI